MRVLAVLTCGALVACAEADPAATTDTADVAAPAPTTAAPSARAADEVLTAADLPEGWSEVPAVESATGDDSCLSGLRAPGGPFDAALTRTATFTAGGIGPFLVASVVERPAEQVLPAVDDVLVACDGQQSATGSTTTVQAAPVDGLPPSALAVRGSDLTEDGSGVRFVLAAAGTEAATVMVFGVTPLGEFDEDVAATALDAAYARLPAS